MRRWAYDVQQSLSNQAIVQLPWGIAKFEITFKSEAKYLAKLFRAPCESICKVMLNLEMAWHAHLIRVAPELKTNDVDMTEVSWKKGNRFVMV